MHRCPIFCHNQRIYLDEYMHLTMHLDTLHPSYSESLFLHVVKQNSLFLLSGFSFTNIQDSQDSRGRRRLFLYILSATSTRFNGIQKLAGLLLQKAHLCARVAARLKPGSFGFLMQTTNL